MSHLLKYTDWESNGKWYSGDVSDLGNGSNYWWIPARMLGIELTDFVLLLKDIFHIDKIHYNKDKNVLCYSWKNYVDCHKYTLFINREARNRKFMI